MTSGTFLESSDVGDDDPELGGVLPLVNFALRWCVVTALKYLLTAEAFDHLDVTDVMKPSFAYITDLPHITGPRSMTYALVCKSPCRCNFR